MANTLNLGTDGNWATKEGSLLGYNSENSNYKPLAFDFSRDSKATVINKDGLIEEVGNNVPRIDYKDDTKGALLLEPSRTNLVSYSEAFDNSAWVKGFNIATTPIVTPNQSISPDGNITSDKIVFPIVSSGFSIVTRPITVTNNYYSQSIYLKGELGNETIWLMNTKDGITYYEIECNLTTQWQRFNYSALLTSGADNIQFGIDTRSATQSSNTIQTIYAWGAQIEEGSYATSYIPTQGGVVTRLVDACYNDNLANVIGQTEGTFYLETVPLNSSTNYTERVMQFESSGSGFMTIQRYSNSNITFYGTNGSNNWSIQGTGLFVGGQTIKIAGAYKDNDIALYVNGVQIGTNTSANAPQTEKLRFANNPSGSLGYVGTHKEVKLYNTRLSNSELAALTQV